MDSQRWEGFEYRSSDIVITTPPKCGTTWTQMLCAMLIFDGPDFPAPLSELSPWLDQTIYSLDTVRALSMPRNSTVVSSRPTHLLMVFPCRGWLWLLYPRQPVLQDLERQLRPGEVRSSQGQASPPCDAVHALALGSEPPSSLTSICKEAGRYSTATPPSRCR
jgi:hypothetical protein